jgi:hypothetical protein
MVDPITGVDSNLAGLADVVNRQNVGASQKARNELIRQQTQQGTSPDLSSLYSTQQPGQSNQLSNIPDILNSRYKYTAPATEDELRNMYAEGGSGFDFTKNPYGSWDLGNSMILAPKYNVAGYNGAGADPFFAHSNDYNNPGYFKPYNEDGSFNPEGWGVRSTKSHALGHIMGTLGVLAAPVAAYWGPALSGATEAGTAATTGTAGTMGAGESMFFGGTNAIAPTTAQSAGMFGNKAWDLGNKYINKAAEGALKGFLFSGGDPKAALQGGIMSPLGTYISDAANPYIGSIASKTLGGAASGALSSLFTKNSPIAGSLYGGMSGGLNAYLNSVNANADPFNKLVSGSLAGIVKKKIGKK